MFLKNKDFFAKPARVGPKAPGDQPDRVPEENHTAEPDGQKTETATMVQLRVQDEQLQRDMAFLDACSRETGRPELHKQLSELRDYLNNARFTVAVVGEFNRGKSTLVNKLLGQDVIPVSALPSTLLPIRVEGGHRDELIWKKPGGETHYPLKPETWDTLEEEIGWDGKAKGELVLRQTLPVLQQNELALLDTPGTNSQVKGDLSMAEEALSGCDCAILTIAAVAPVSESELRFLQEGILTKKVPRILVVLTKLDLLSEKERELLIRNVQARLDSLQEGLPLYLSQSGLVPGWEEKAGPKAIRDQLTAWLRESDHTYLKCQRAHGLLSEMAEELRGLYACQLEVLEEKKEARREKVEEKKRQLLGNSHIQWDQLEIEMLNRCNQNFTWIREMTEERQQDVIEKLTLELSHTNNPKDWWEKDYPYRMKMEMIALGNALESNLQSFYTRDLGWLNHVLQEKYKAIVPPQNQRMADKGVFRGARSQAELSLEDMHNTRLISRVGTGVVTVAGYLLFGMMGLSPLGMAVGIGGGIVSELFMNRRVEEQRARLGQTIRTELPGVFSRCVETVEKNVRETYRDAIGNMQKACQNWANAQCEAMEKARQQGEDPTKAQAIRQKVEKLAAMIQD